MEALDLFFRLTCGGRGARLHVRWKKNTSVLIHLGTLMSLRPALYWVPHKDPSQRAPNQTGGGVYSVKASAGERSSGPDGTSGWRRMSRAGIRGRGRCRWTSHFLNALCSAWTHSEVLNRGPGVNP